mmetsp:Transcript_13299/g.23401  ORF Transcript_13299/g.23401 Transcript_13299/m.23401 type:complete len:109 (+) Transcript_13299:93-419(+)|eukprot:CAMPEP_0119103226 /NCGR_PEP_ID=MMETSP1180-20130426/1716_1 /TAXON_ID=3052 ORGANISM="Chlamydomonas cf sp, Strain CCMP681" /NCGR_SAMPLE_ID=MMETSP1180 /ASSEMBLY_ACC=CAM_ASM_000741 /LENGTH=108 /DNA_ID=CAMNT_0007087673 /DNA_START=89 /DNA_END=415 /DNA_ORIENTATION=+
MAEQPASVMNSHLQFGTSYLKQMEPPAEEAARLRQEDNAQFSTPPASPKTRSSQPATEPKAPGPGMKLRNSLYTATVRAECQGDKVMNSHLSFGVHNWNMPVQGNPKE